MKGLPHEYQSSRSRFHSFRFGIGWPGCCWHGDARRFSHKIKGLGLVSKGVGLLFVAELAKSSGESHICSEVLATSATFATTKGQTCS